MHRPLGLTIAAIVFALDQATKYLIVNLVDLPSRGEIVLLPFFKLLWVNNAGVSLGLLTAETSRQGWLLVALTAAIAVGVAAWLWRERNRRDVVGLSLVLGGAAGNIVDRVRTGIALAPVDEPGHVIDFANLHFGGYSPFMVFNVADAAISFGVLILLLGAFLARDKSKVSSDA